MRKLILIVLAVLLGGSVVLGGGPAGAQTDTTEAGGGATTTTTEGRVVGVSGVILNDDEPVEGVVIVVKDASGAVVGEATTNADGEYDIPLPGPGDYSSTLDVDSLPDGVNLRNEDRATLEFTLRPGQNRPLLYPLGESDRQEVGGVEKFLQLLVEGIKFGLVIAMGAIGLSLIFGTTGLTNFSHGEMVTFGAMVAWWFNVNFGIQLIPAAVLAIIVGAAVAALYDFAFWRRLRKRGTGLIAMLVISIGMAVLFRYFFLYLFGSRTRPYADYAVQKGVDIGPISIAPKDIISIILSIAVLVAVGLVLNRTKIGKAMRAVADNKDLAASSGIDVDRVILFVWAAGGGLAALGGVLFGVTEQVSYQMGFRLLLLMFAGVTLGGLGTAYGALVGSLIVGIFVQVSTLWVPVELKNVGALVILILILLVRPQGILGQSERVG
ncbi:MAG: branched-chain amino acid ABC transporter permease [Acidimicrobiales bacterium]|nr:branched-chain amino acid ABC transporter permease [Acidimicrobiales bacterium]MCB9373885.1 branched-chain amino acid ABC transporter permease [Microthrixaceae bacterium]